MHLDPQKSREAHTETRRPRLSPAAASIDSQEHPDSPAHCDLRGSQPTVGRGATAGQPFPLGDAVDLPPRPHRHVRPIPATVLDSILERHPAGLRAANDRLQPKQPDPALGGPIGVAIMVIVVLLIAFFASTGGTF